jgi:high-affinity iron transporter
VLANFLIGLREGLEAGLIVGVLIAYINKLDRHDILPRLWFGIAAAVVLSLGIGAALTWGPYGLSFQAQEILGGVLSILAVALVTWMIFWMAKHAKDLSSGLRSKLDAALAGTGMGIVIIGFISVAREGIETALFVWASVNSSSNAVVGTTGAVLGILTAVVVAYLIYRGLVRINFALFFRWTGAFLVVIAAGVLSYGIGDLQEASIIPGHGQAAYSLAAVIPPTSWYGSALGGIFNFTPEPSSLQVVAWFSYLVIVGALFLRRSVSRRERSRAAVSPVHPITPAPPPCITEWSTSP